MLRAVRAALMPFDTDLADLEKRAKAHDDRAKAHEENDVNRFLQLHHGMADLEHRLEFVLNMITLMRDDMHEGFQRLGARIEKKDPNEVTPPRRGRNGR